MKCDQSDAKKHTGPFKLLRVDEESGFTVARCEGCGNAFYQYGKKPKGKPKQKPQE
jgi:hypothetical protein